MDSKMQLVDFASLC